MNQGAHLLRTPSPWMDQIKETLSFFNRRSYRITAEEEGELRPLVIFMYIHRNTDSFVVSVGTISRLLMLWPLAAAAVGTLLRRARQGGRGGRSPVWSEGVSA